MAVEPRDARIAELEAELQELTKKLKEAEIRKAALQKIADGEYSSTKLPKMPDIPEQERTPAVLRLMEAYYLKQEQLRELKDELARLKK